MIKKVIINLVVFIFSTLFILDFCFANELSEQGIPSIGTPAQNNWSFSVFTGAFQPQGDIDFFDGGLRFGGNAYTPIGNNKNLLIGLNVSYNAIEEYNETYDPFENEDDIYSSSIEDSGEIYDMLAYELVYIKDVEQTIWNYIIAHNIYDPEVTAEYEEDVTGFTFDIVPTVRYLFPNTTSKAISFFAEAGVGLSIQSYEYDFELKALVDNNVVDSSKLSGSDDETEIAMIVGAGMNYKHLEFITQYNKAGDAETISATAGYRF